MPHNIETEIRFSNNLLVIFNIGFDEFFRLFIESSEEDQKLFNDKLIELNSLIRNANDKRSVKFIFKD